MEVQRLRDRAEYILTRDDDEQRRPLRRQHRLVLVSQACYSKQQWKPGWMAAPSRENSE